MQLLIITVVLIVICSIIYDPLDSTPQTSPPTNTSEKVMSRLTLCHLCLCHGVMAQSVQCLCIKYLFVAACGSAAFEWYALVFRHDQPRSDSFPGEGLPHATLGQLSHRTLWNYAGVLEEQAWRPSHIWLPAECLGGFLHSHRKPVPASAMIHIITCPFSVIWLFFHKSNFHIHISEHTWTWSPFASLSFTVSHSHSHI